MRLGLIPLGYQPQDMATTTLWLAMTPLRGSKKTGVLSLYCSRSGVRPWTTENKERDKAETDHITVFTIACPFTLSCRSEKIRFTVFAHTNRRLPLPLQVRSQIHTG